MYLVQRFAWLALTGIALLVALFGLFRLMVDYGVSPLRYVVQDAGVLAAGLLGMALCWLRGRHLKLQQEAERALTGGFTGEWLEASAAPWKQALGLLFFALMAVASWLMYLDSGDVRGLLLTPPLVVLMVLLGLNSMAWYRSGRPALRLDAGGLDHVFFGRVPWAEVRHIRLETIALRGPVKAQALVLDVADAAPYLARRPWIVRFFSGSSHASTELTISLNPLDEHPALVTDAAMTLWGRARLPEGPHDALSLDQEFLAVGQALKELHRHAGGLSEEELLRRLQPLEARLQAATERRSRDP